MRELLRLYEGVTEVYLGAVLAYFNWHFPGT